MATGLLALFDDVAAIAKVAAASVDDVAGQAAKAGAKSAGVVIDDTAVAPKYVVGFTADREWPIVVRIARGSLKNKLVILLPIALVLSLVLPGALTPLLMAGGTYLCYEGAEKVLEAVLPHKAHAHEEGVGLAESDPKALEDRKVASAIRTDFILSAEIMAIALATIRDIGIVKQAIVLAIVGFGITLGVYGLVALVVKADDVGVALARRPGDSTGARFTRRLGLALVGVMPGVLKTLAIVGTAAMVWVGGGIIMHGLETFGIDGPAHLAHHLAEVAGDATPVAPRLVGWVASAATMGVFGLVLGAAVIPVVGAVIAPLWRRFAPNRPASR